MKTLLVLTTGQSDVQLVHAGLRRELSKDCCGVLHDEFEQREYDLVDAPAQKDKAPLETLPEGGLSLCTPKLDAVLRSFKEGSPTAAIIFETRRALRSDPRLAGAVLELRLTRRGVRVRRHTFLEGDERLEDSTSELDGVVRRAIVDELSSVIASEIEAVKPERIVVATTGGLPAANEVIAELVRLHAVGGPQVVALKVPDGALAAQDDLALEEKFHPAAGIRARWHALSLIEKGNLLGAWGAVSHLKNAPGQEWIRVVEWLALFAASLPQEAECDIQLLKHNKMAVRSALRVELALRAGDIPRAIHGTVAFFEAALWDHLEVHITSRDSRGRWEIFQLHPDPDQQLLSGDGHPFKQVKNGSPGNWYKINDKAPQLRRVAEEYLKKPALVSFADAVSNIRNLRNDVAHKEPTEALMHGASRAMAGAGLWSHDARFLTQALVQDVLIELNEPLPESLADGLLKIVRERLLASQLGTRQA